MTVPQIIFSLARYPLPAILDGNHITIFLPSAWQLSKNNFDLFIKCISEAVTHETIHWETRHQLPEEWHYNELGVSKITDWLGFYTVYALDNSVCYEHLHSYLVKENGGDAPSLKFIAALLVVGTKKSQIKKLTGLSKKDIDTFWKNLTKNEYIHKKQIFIDDINLISLLLMGLVAEGKLRVSIVKNSK